MQNLKTKITSYFFDTRKPEDAAAYGTLAARLKAEGAKKFHAIGDHYDSRFLKGFDIELETTHLFNNQWNTAPIGDAKNGLRVFDWAEDAIFNNGIENRNIKRGHYLDITPEIREIRRNTMACGYCGKQEPAQKGYVFCPHCHDSDYLESKDLHLLRMKAIDDTSERGPLTEAEAAYLLPLYKAAQLHGNTERGKARIAKKRADIKAKFEKETAAVKAEFEGFSWLMDQGIKTENVIFYSHTGRFCFGWRKPIDDSFKSEILELISEFPSPYDLKCADGRTLSGD